MSELIQSINLPLFDVKDQRIISKKTYKIDLYKEYIKYELEFESDETDEVAFMAQRNEYTDPAILNTLEVPTKKVYREEVSYIDRLAIKEITFSRSSDNDHGMVTIDLGTQEDTKFFYKNKHKALELIEILKAWRWH